ncbi:MAG: DUF4176 domain-containing protein [Defluviitaleaceae bacterium]|nr:DUF4176 domain-containing protein [Defluviitaleaceae bacterium]
MNNVALFNESLKHYVNVGDISLDELSRVGKRIGSHIESLKGIYRSYSNQEKRYEFEVKSFFGNDHEAIEATFDFENDEIIISTSGVEVKLTQTLFLKYLNLIDLCFSKILPIGSVIQLDVDMMPEAFRKSFGGSRESMFTISGRKVSVQGKFGACYVDYVARLFPMGESELAQPFLISNLMVKQVIHEGFSNELEVAFAENVLRQDVIHRKGRSLSFLLEDEVKAVEEAILHMTNTTGETS